MQPAERNAGCMSIFTKAWISSRRSVVKHVYPISGMQHLQPLLAAAASLGPSPPHVRSKQCGSSAWQTPACPWCHEGPLGLLHGEEDPIPEVCGAPGTQGRFPVAGFCLCPPMKEPAGIDGSQML